jgi:histidine ammonia-lyase
MKAITILPKQHLSSGDIKAVADGAFLEISDEVAHKIKESNDLVKKLIDGKKVIYGITTGFGNFKNIFINKDQVEELQINLIRSHACGVGKEFSAEEVRAMMAVRLLSLTKGNSGVRIELIDLVRDLLNKGITPAVPSQGSVGASGDLVPLCHMGLLLAGEGYAYYDGVKMRGLEALNKAGLKPIIFQAKEGLAWSNGTSVMTGLSALVSEDAKKIIKWADIICALSFEALRGCTAALDPRIHEVRNQRGQIESAKNLRELLAGSKLVDTELERVQDSYTLRCTPQVHGACIDAVLYAQEIISREINAVTDNPLTFLDTGEVLSGGNFHGEPIAITMDFLGIALSEIANISERRTAKLIDTATNHGLPAFLIPKEKAGLCNGFMIPQYVSASLVSENKVLAHPASVDSIPTSANQEDHVSMGTIAARKARDIVNNVYNVLAIEMLNACQAIDFLDKEKMAPKTSEFYREVRKISAFVGDDRSLSEDIARISDYLKAN